MSNVRAYLAAVTKLLEEVDIASVEHVIDLFWDCYQKRKRLVVCGNGGSAATASHFVCDLQKNMFVKSGHRNPWEVISLGESMALVTAWSNDTSYQNVFAAQAQCWLRPGDLFLAISGSGNSPNVIEAAKVAKQIGATVISWSGYGGGKIAELTDHKIVLHSHDMQHVEDVHMIIMHTVYTALVERLKETQ